MIIASPDTHNIPLYGIPVQINEFHVGIYMYRSSPWIRSYGDFAHSNTQSWNMERWVVFRSRVHHFSRSFCYERLFSGFPSVIFTLSLTVYIYLYIYIPGTKDWAQSLDWKFGFVLGGPRPSKIEVMAGFQVCDEMWHQLEQTNPI